ncbi:MAG: DEAD/DEAH box helicase [Phycisphaerales bacterium]|nr:DEAD/DEAH box helicase [Phycisphaerales bacterium]
MNPTVQALWDGREVHLCAPVETEGSAPLPAQTLRGLLAGNGHSTSDPKIEPLLLSAGRIGQIRIGPEREVPTLAWGAADGLDVLLALAGDEREEDSLFAGENRNGGPAFQLGHSVRYWGQLAQLAMQMLVGRRFYPDLEEGPQGQLAAAWRPAPGVHLTELLPRYAAAMPEACRMVHRPDEDGREIEPLARVESFLNHVIDHWIRRAVSDDPFFDRPHELAGQFSTPMEVRWLSALLGTDSQLRGEVADQAILLEQVRNWTGRLDEHRQRIPWRLCITLLEPRIDPPLDSPQDPPANSWRLSFSLQSPEDQSQVIEAADLFNQPPLLGRTVAHHRAQLQSELSRASAICPPLERLEGQPSPTGLELSATEAHLFIRRWSAGLRELEIRCFLPAWAGNGESELGLILNVRPGDIDDPEAPLPAGGNGKKPVDFSSGRMGLGALLHFDWQVAVGDLNLSIHDFSRLVEQQQPLVRFGNKWLEIDPQAAETAMEYLRRQSTGKMSLAQALRTAWGASRTEAGLPVMGVRGTGWLADFLEQTPTAAVAELQQPSDFGGTLRPYQLRGLQWLAFLDQLGIGACLADDMGLGKTIQLIALMLHERSSASNNGIGPTLLFAPTSVVGNWQRELERFAPSLRVLVHHGPGRLGGDAFAEAAKQHDVILTSYALAHRDQAELSAVSWHRLALDEAQKIKNPSAASSVAIRSLEANLRVALTGTPIENHLSELWSIMDLLNPTFLGSAAEFRERFAIPIERLADSARAERLRRLIRPFILRRTKSDPRIAGELPDKMEMKVFCNLTGEQAALYQQITSQMLDRIDSAAGIRRRGLILAALTRLKQVCDHPALLESSPSSSEGENHPIPSATALSGRSGKVERLVEMLEEVIEEGDAALIFTQYRQMGHLLEKILHQRLKTPLLFLHGGTPARQRQAMIDRFQSPVRDHRLFILSLRAGGLGLNLTAANHVFHFDRWWNPAVEAQATDRAHRLGQTRTVQVHKYICAGTVEERIDKLLGDKLALADRIVSSGDEWLTNLSTDELRNYLTLSQDAVGDFES